MGYPLKTLRIVLMQRDNKGNPETILPDDGPEFSQVAACIHLARQFIAYPKSLSAFAGLGNAVKEKGKLDSWWGSQSMAEITRDFLEMVLNEWFPTVVDYSINHPDVMGATHRRPLTDSFDTRREVIALNGSRISDICDAAKMAAASTGPDSAESQRYRRFVFFTATVLVHEVGHIFVTYLNQGKFATPPKVSGNMYESSEAGGHLECILFGGRVVGLRNRGEDGQQPGDPYLFEFRRKLYVITQDTIDDAVAHKITLPLPLGEIVADPASKITLGSEIPFVPKEITDVRIFPRYKELLLEHEHFGSSEVNPRSFNWDSLQEIIDKAKDHSTFRTDPQSAIHRLPFEPGLLAEKAN